ncbi:ABC transporter substrate-binding protein [Microbacterium sp. YY-01]|uniref:ABC transporter substrate-binding protein n=1 Tax=Microbacterium sp. YY-01 TaxID=3421634 RepID=UPI003D179A73
MSLSRTTARFMTGLAGVGVLTLALTACGSADNGSSNNNSSGDSFGEFKYLAAVENSIVRDEITTLGEGACQAENDAMPFEVETLPQADVSQRVTLLASQDSLPNMFTAPTAPLRPGGVLGDDDTVINLEDKLTELGVIDNILPGAISAVKNVYGDRFVSMPYQYNLEGIFYNKQIFDDNGISVPETWDDLMAAAEKLEKASVTPFALPGDQDWMITRWISGYMFRDLGPDAIDKVLDGDAKFTDPEYLKTFEAIQDFGGFFGPGVSTMDMATAVNEFFTGKAAMMYNGTWFLAEIYDDAANPSGADAFGFMPLPEVAGGEGSIDQYPANAGAATSFSAKLDNAGMDAWLTCITENFGSSALANQGVISGFTLNQPVDDVPALTSEIQDIMAETTETITWLEAFLPEKAAGEAATNAGPLLTGNMSPDDYAKRLQAGLEASK